MIEARWYSGFEDLTDAHMIRRAVYIDEQGVDPEEEFDGTDEACMHLVLYDDGAPVATGRVMWDNGKFLIGRVAVLKDRRGEKLGDFVVRLCIRKAFDSGGETQYIRAQIHARKFYEKLGFEAYGDEFLEANIPHICMKRHGDVG